MLHLGSPLVAGLAAPLTTMIDVDVPGQGIVCGGDQLLGLDLRSPCTASDHWMRGDDIIAVYEPDDPRHLRATALWRSRSLPGIAAWELIASATTSRTQSDTSLAVVSEIATAAVIWGCATAAGIQWHDVEPMAFDCLLVRRPAAAGGSVFVAVHPADSRGIVVQSDHDRIRVAGWLFSAAAEKGVLFRGRAVAAIGPTAGDMEWAERLWAEFIAAPPMLTA
jgi:hypothetical protein